MQYVLFDDPKIRISLLPFTFTRPVSEIRCGICTITEKWTQVLESDISFKTQSYLVPKYGSSAAQDPESTFINGALCPTEALVAQIKTLKAHEAIVQNGTLLAYREGYEFENQIGASEWVEKTTVIRYIWDIFAENGDQIRADFARITKNKTSLAVTDQHTACYHPENIFIEGGANIRAAILNAESGPIYIGKNATVSEGSIIIGPFALGEGATVNWGAKMRMNTTVGPHCKVGGEVGNSVFFANSNKAHDGFLGNSVVGEWCNLGANTNNSNLKNDYTNVKIHSYETNTLEDSGKMFCGLFMGDFSKAGISTMFNTGTVVGVNVNVFGAGFQPKHIPSFSWGGAAEGFSTYRFEKAAQVARETMSRRGKIFSQQDEDLLRWLMQNR